jgi:hypothetical protein
MGSFSDDIYPLRFRRADFTRALLPPLNNEWRRVTTVGHGRDVPGDVQRCAIGGGSLLNRSVQCNYTPVIMDKRRVKTILRAWGRQISDRYLINHLRREEGRYGAGGVPGHFWAAVRTWLVENRNNGVYRQYDIRLR